MSNKDRLYISTENTLKKNIGATRCIYKEKPDAYTKIGRTTRVFPTFLHKREQKRLKTYFIGDHTLGSQGLKVTIYQTSEKEIIGSHDKRFILIKWEHKVDTQI